MISTYLLHSVTAWVFGGLKPDCDACREYQTVDNASLSSPFRGGPQWCKLYEQVGKGINDSGSQMGKEIKVPCSQAT